MKLLTASILCFIGALICLMLMSCVPKEYRPLPEGKETLPPIGYVIFCAENPDSIFCKEGD